MKIFTNDALRAIDAQTIDSGEVTAMQLIETVAERVTSEIVKRWSQSRPVVVFAGPGNNGADALAVARMLAFQGYSCYVYLFNIKGNKLSAECKTARDLLLTSVPDVNFVEVVDQMSLPELTPQWLVVDGLFGSGLRGPLTGGFQELVRKINESGADVVSIDVPSGLGGDWNPEAVARNIIHATLTLAVGFPRISFFFPEHAELVGEWKIIDLPLSQQAIRSTQTNYFYLEKANIKPVLRPRDPFASKADFGSALLVAGSYGMAGAACLAARGVLRSGAGKVTVYGPRATMPVVQTAVNEAMFVADDADDAISEIVLHKEYDAVGIGSGIGTSQQAVHAFERFLKSYARPLVIDADALNCIARRQDLLDFIPEQSVLTPHAREFDRLFGVQPTAESRLLKAVEVARRYRVVIVLKGRYTATVRPDGRIYFNSSGTPAMATPGAGDVLTGIITSLMAQNLSPDVAAVTAVFIHGLAGEIAAGRHGDYGVTAGDIADSVGEAIVAVNK